MSHPSTSARDFTRLSTAEAIPSRKPFIHRESAEGENRSLKLFAHQSALEHFFVTAPRGLEAVLAQELKEISELVSEKIDGVQAGEGGVHLQGSMALAWAINLHSRVGNRVLWKLAEGLYRDDRDIYTLARQIAWSQFFREHDSFRVDTIAVFSPLKSIAIASLRAKDGLCDHFRDIYGVRPSVDKVDPQVRVRLFIEKLKVSFYLDLSGEPLFKRGYRRSLEHSYSSIAPIRENVAAGLLKVMAWQPHQPLYDPFCGGGTFLIEAARIALNIPSGGARSFAFENLLSFNATQWNALRTQALDHATSPQSRRQKALSLPLIMGADIDRSAIANTRALITQWGWQDWISLSTGDFLNRPAPSLPKPSHLVADETPLLIANPPYGERMGSQETLLEQYPLWGTKLKRDYVGWRTGWITGDAKMAKAMGLRPQKKMAMFNGDLPVQFFEIPMFSGRRQEHLQEQTQRYRVESD
jgi:putative N6-adenine-specific DNA methylase